MVPLSIEPLKTSRTRGFTPGCRFSAWPVAAKNSVYSALPFNIYSFSSKFLISSISSLTLGKWVDKPKAYDMAGLNFIGPEV